MTDNAYPLALYADGGDELIWGKPVRTLIVGSAQEEGEALSNGWRLHPISEEQTDYITAEVIEPVKRGPGRPRKVEA